jgi:cell wall assembly regulator SMI1
MDILKVDHREIKAWLLLHHYDLGRLRGSAGPAAERFECILYSRLCHEIRSSLHRGDGQSTAEVLSRISFLETGFPEAFDSAAVEASTH